LEFTIRSKALYSTWIYYKPERLLFDAGEGISAELGNKIYGIEKIFLTHSHIDHISGLWGIINTRNNAMGSREKDLEIYYPAESSRIEDYLNFIKSMNKKLRYKLSFIPLLQTDTISLGNNKFLEPFRTKHSPGEFSYGYKITEKRKRLKSEFSDLKKEDLIKLSRENGKNYIVDIYDASLVIISGDSLPVPYEIAKNTETLVHECTFIIEKDRNIRNHTTLPELKELVKKVNPKRLIIYHVSSRYNKIIKSTEDALNKEFPNIDITIVNPESVSEL